MHMKRIDFLMLKALTFTCSSCFLILNFYIVQFLIKNSLNIQTDWLLFSSLIKEFKFEFLAFKIEDNLKD